MKQVTIGEINKFIIHFVGNKNNGDGVKFSDTLSNHLHIEEYIKKLITNSFKFEELFQFYFSPNVELNPMYQFLTDIFKIEHSFLEQSKNIGRFLYDKSIHPHIKAGELCLIYFKDCQVDDEIVDGVGIFKSENKDTFLKFNNSNNGINLVNELGMNINKLDKGCLIFNTQKENGYLISLVDSTNRGSDAQYWKDDFLHIMPNKDEYHHTKDFLTITKNYLTKQFSEDFNNVEKTDKIDLLNRSVEYFKNKEVFDRKDFESEVLQDENLVESFQNYKQNYEQQNDVKIEDSFEISTQAVKKQARVFKSVLKLDKNFHIYIHGNKEMIEKGVDETGRKFYKIYYQDEE